MSAQLCAATDEPYGPLPSSDGALERLATACQLFVDRLSRPRTARLSDCAPRVNSGASRVNGGASRVNPAAKAVGDCRCAGRTG